MSESLAIQSEALLSSKQLEEGQRSGQNLFPAELFGAEFQRQLLCALGSEVGFSPPETEEAGKTNEAQPSNGFSAGNSLKILEVDKAVSADPAIGGGIELMEDADFETTKYDGEVDAFSLVTAETPGNLTEATKSISPDNVLAADADADLMSESQRNLSKHLHLSDLRQETESVTERDARLRALLLAEQNTPGFWQRIQERFPGLNFYRQNSDAVERVKAENLSAELSGLIKFPFDAEMNALQGDVWVQQVWPLPETQSIFNGGVKIDVPYNPERDTAETPDADSIKEWDSKFEAGWAAARTDQSADPKAENESFKGVSEQSEQDAVSAKNVAFDSLPEGDKLFKEMVKRVRLNLDQGNYRMSLELYPENLGRLNLKVSLQGEKLNARFLVESEAVRSLMLSKMDELKESLDAKGVSLDRLEIAVLKNTDTPLRIQEDFRRPSEPTHTHYTGDSLRVAYFNPEQAGLSNTWVV